MNQSLKLRLVEEPNNFCATPIQNPKSRCFKRMVNPPTLGTETLKDFQDLSESSHVLPGP